MRFFFLIFFFFFAGCVQKNKIPRGILPQDEMRHIIWDLMRADKFTETYIIKDTTRNKKTESIKLYEQIFRIYNTNLEKFQKSLTFYEGRPDLLKVIIDSLRSNEKYVMEDQYKETKSKPIDSLIKKSKLKVRPEE